MKKFLIMMASALAIVAGLWAYLWAYNTSPPVTSWANQIKAMNNVGFTLVGGTQDSFLTVLSASEVRWYASPALTAWATATSIYRTQQLAAAITRLAVELNPVALVPNQFAHYCYWNDLYWNDLRRDGTNPILRT